MKMKMFNSLSKCKLNKSNQSYQMFSLLNATLTRIQTTEEQKEQKQKSLKPSQLITQSEYNKRNRIHAKLN